MTIPTTLFEKIWRRHVIMTRGSSEALLHIDRNFVHEGSFHAFDLLKLDGRAVRRPSQTFGFADHYVPTLQRDKGLAAIVDAEARGLVQTLESNAREHGFTHFGLSDPQQGIVHVVGPELGLTQPGITIICPDSHTATHGALGAYAFGVGAAHLLQTLATQSLWERKPRTMRIVVDGRLALGVTAKDVILYIIATIGVAGATGHAVEYAGTTIRSMSMEERMTVCNMSIEAGARAGMIAPDDVTFEYLANRRYAPKGENWEKALTHWRSLPSDAEASFDQEVRIDVNQLAPMVTWGTNPEQALPITASVPDPLNISDAGKRTSAMDALRYMGIKPGVLLSSIEIDRVFIGSCANSRIEDLRIAARIAKGRKARVPTLVTPGSMAVKRQAEAEGLDKVFRDAGFDWRAAGCSMCVGFNGDLVPAGERCASTSNRNFEGRQGKGARTHLVSPAMAAAAAITGRLTDVRTFF